ncbi:MAG TPA: peptide chain release factor N(5)-glutamine methyltransferase [Chlamydiales bacterium]|nr:peptide chain release factor N(5)-glutamine methyltransferase [Chlamydiales bacterium]
MLLPSWVEKELSLRSDRQALLERGASGEPWEYILGNVAFYGCQIHVDRRTLIPRCETEWLVDRIAKENPKGALWDICTGSGCIGIALKKNFPYLEVSISDLSSDALSLALKNSQVNQVDISFYQGDFLTPFLGKKADWIVSNPPYVSEEEYLTLDLSVKEFEPKMALIAENEGLKFYQRFASEAPSFLHPGGHIFLEIGYQQGERVKKIFHTEKWRDQKVFQDLSGKDRFFYAKNF